MVSLFDPLGITGLFAPRNVATGGSTIVNSRSLRLSDASALNQQQNFGLLNIGDKSFTFAPQTTTETINEGDTITNIIGSQVEGFTVSRSQSLASEQSSEPSTTFEKPLQFAPSLAGSATSATGEAEASSGLNLVALGLVGGAVFLGFTLLNKKGGKK